MNPNAIPKYPRDLYGDSQFDSRSPGKIGMTVFGIVLVIGFAYAGSQLLSDLAPTRGESAFPYIMLGIALLVALGFEFVNGFHDTANAVATVI